MTENNQEPQQPYNQAGAGEQFLNQLGVDNVTPAPAQTAPQPAPQQPAPAPVQQPVAPQPQQPAPQPVAPVQDNFDINKIIQEVQADAEKQKQELLKSVEEEVGKNNYKKDEVNQILQKAFETFQTNQAKTQEKYESEINAMKERMAQVDAQMSSRTSVVRGNNNPYRYQNPTPGQQTRDWFEDPNVSNEDKLNQFKEYLKHN